MSFYRRRLSKQTVRPFSYRRLSEWDENIFESFLQVLLSTPGKQNSNSRSDLYKDHSILNSKKQTTNKWIHLSNSEKQNLYIEVLYTIKHKIGSTCGGHSPFIQDLFDFSQKVFGVSLSEHRSMLIAASEEKPPIVVLNVTVVQARDLEAKDADGYSDPYVMLGIIPGKRINENIAEDSDVFNELLNLDSVSSSSARDKSPRRIKNFGKSLRKKVGGSEKHLSVKSSSIAEKKSVNKSSGNRESIPAKFIQTTSVKPNTMTPVWNELFRFDIENIQYDKLHLDIWDHDDEESVFDAVKKLNEVKGVKGLSRYFKQVGQSARTSSGDVDDFLGCITVDLDNIPSIGMKQWFKLEGRNSKSRAQGEIELELKLSTREDRNFSEENNWLDILQHEDLLKMFVKYELQFLKDGSKSWNGEMREEAETILHQHAIQGDMTELQILVCRWLVLTEIYRTDNLNPRILFDFLQKMENKWQPGLLSRNEMNLLATSFSHFIEHCLEKLKHFRNNFPIENDYHTKQLKQILKILTTLSSSSLYRAVSPFENELSSQLITIIKRSANEVLENSLVAITIELENNENEDWKELLKYLKLISIVNKDLFDVERFYHNIFAKEANIKLFQLIYKIYVKKINKIIIENNHLSNLSIELNSLLHNFDSFDCYRVLIDFFSMFVNLQQFYSYQDVLVTDDFGSFDSVDYFSWFKNVLEKWIDFAKYKLEKKIEYLIDVDEMNMISDNQMLSSNSASNITTAFEVVEHIWKKIQWSDVTGKVNYVTLLTQALGNCGLLYADTLHEKVRLAGYFDECGQFDLSRQVCIALNNINHIDQYLNRIPMSLAFDQLANEVATNSGDKHAGKTLLETMLSIIQQSRDYISGVIQNIIQRVSGKMRPEIRKNIFHLCWSPQSVNVEKASGDLITYLYENISTVRIQLHSAIFSNVIAGIWSEVLSQINEQANKEVDENENTNSEENSDNSFVIDRLYKCLDILSHFFIGVDDNITLLSLQTQQYEIVKYLLKLYTSTTKEIVEFYYKEKLEEQTNCPTNSEYGSINVKIYYKRCSGTLLVEIINARGLIPLDSNGLSDPFVIIELAPVHYYSQSMKPIKTKIIKNSLNPDFNESFEIQVKLDQITRPGATLVLTIMDHDMLMTDDLEGLVFVNLNNIQGINTEISKNSNVKPINYPIILPKYEVNKALFVLEKHKSDLYANEMLKKWLPIEKSVS